jgi:ADP-ribose pyrophosphatase YjhB (NUDIX family)
MSNRYTPYAAALVFLIRDEEILLMRRANAKWANGQYTIPSGHIDEGESASEAAARETLEEVGVQINPKSLQFVHVLHRQNTESRDVYVDFFFVANEWEGEPSNCEPEHCDDVSWFSLNELPDNIVPFVKDVIKAYLDKSVYSELGWE